MGTSSPESSPEPSGSNDPLLRNAPAEHCSSRSRYRVRKVLDRSLQRDLRTPSVLVHSISVRDPVRYQRTCSPVAGSRPNSCSVWLFFLKAGRFSMALQARRRR